MQLLGGGFELVDLVGREGVAGLLVPVGLAVEDVEVEPDLLELLLPARPRGDGLAPHDQLELEEPLLEAELPKPPRWLVPGVAWLLSPDGEVVVVELLLLPERKPEPLLLLLLLPVGPQAVPGGVPGGQAVAVGAPR